MKHWIVINRHVRDSYASAYAAAAAAAVKNGERNKIDEHNRCGLWPLLFRCRDLWISFFDSAFRPDWFQSVRFIQISKVALLCEHTQRMKVSLETARLVGNGVIDNNTCEILSVETISIKTLRNNKRPLINFVRTMRTEIKWKTEKSIPITTATYFTPVRPIEIEREREHAGHVENIAMERKVSQMQCICS